MPQKAILCKLKLLSLFLDNFEGKHLLTVLTRFMLNLDLLLEKRNKVLENNNYTTTAFTALETF